MGGGWWWARAARLARLRFRGVLLPPPRPRSGGARGSFAPGHGPRAGASPPPVSELDRADAWLLRKAHETAFLSWFRNGLLASGIGVISFMQSDMGREAAYDQLPTPPLVLNPTSPSGTPPLIPASSCWAACASCGAVPPTWWAWLHCGDPCSCRWGAQRRAWGPCWPWACSGLVPSGSTWVSWSWMWNWCPRTMGPPPPKAPTKPAGRHRSEQLGHGEWPGAGRPEDRDIKT
uniref:Transmembrane protein 160 n=1 Tax=Felis catus TaxID=9685 RepID=A0ABI7ZYR2_FELCA